MARARLSVPLPVLCGGLVVRDLIFSRDHADIRHFAAGTLSCSLLEARGLTVVLEQFSRPAAQVAAFLRPQHRQPGSSYFNFIALLLQAFGQGQLQYFSGIFSTDPHLKAERSGVQDSRLRPRPHCSPHVLDVITGTEIHTVYGCIYPTTP